MSTIEKPAITFEAEQKILQDEITQLELRRMELKNGPADPDEIARVEERIKELEGKLDSLEQISGPSVN
jgi:hypothetical protein